MNVIASVLISHKNRISLSFRLLQHIKIFKCSLLNTPKLCRITSSSGCLVAGCCFSRQPDEDVLLPKCRKHSSSLDINKSIVEGSNLPQSVGQCSVKDIETMKRKSECTDETVLSYSVENSFLEPHSKKTKTDEIPSHEEDIQQDVAKKSEVCHITTTDESSSTKGRDRSKNLRPNYFVAVQISNIQIHEALQDVQNHILMKEKLLKKSMTKLNTLHITLMVMHIGDPETHARALKALKHVHHEHDDDLSKNPLQLEFKGLSHFHNRVLYAQLSNDDGYRRLSLLAESVKNHFAAASIHTTDSKATFTPHLTVAKIDFKGTRKGVKKIDPSLYKEYDSHYFGSQRVESIQLLSMLNPKNEVGYYSGDELYFSAFNLDDRINSLKQILSIEEKKKEAKDIVNKLMKERFK